MHDYQMTFLADDHRRELLAEASRQRLAATAARSGGRRQLSKPRRPRRFGISLFRGRVAVF